MSSTRLLAFAATLLGLGAAAKALDAPPIAAAADLKFALTEIAERFEHERGKRVKLTFGSSGNLATQIENGGPFELFLSADERYVLRLADRGLTRNRGVLYARGRLVLFAPHGSPLVADGALEDLKAAVREGRIARFAIANPEHAPYGRAARAVLRHAGLWESIESRLVLGENAAQAAQFAASGSCQGGIVPLSLSKAPEMAALGHFAEIPAEWHRGEPLLQRMALTLKAGATSESFYRYLQEPEAREVLDNHGFVLPSDGTE
jgi:molybdate transport system substrate-binding protein